MHCPTTKTSPFPNTKRQLINDMSTVSTAFRAWKPAVNLDQVSSIPCSFVGQLPDQFTPARITDRARQLMVFHHVPHSQILNRDGLVFSHQSSRQLMQKILSRIRDLSVDSCHFQSGFMSIVRTLDLTAQSLLHSFQLLTKSIEVFRVRHLFPSAQSQQAGDAQVNPHRLHRNRQWLKGDVIYQQRNKPSPTSIQLHRNSAGFTAFGQLPAPSDGQGFSAFSQKYLSILPPKPRLGELSGTTMALLFEVWILGSTCPEIAKRFLEVSQSLLQWNTAYFIEKLKLFFFFPKRELSRRLNVVHSLLPFVPSFGSVSQCFVVHQPDTSQRSPEQGFLLRCWVNSVLESSFHPYIIANILEILGALNPTLSAPIPPCAEATGFLGGSR
jgi:hypothetical protein